MKRTLSEAIKKNIAYNQSYKCQICLSLLPPSFQIDHIIPFSISFDDNDNNLQALCANCHSVKTQRENLRINQFKKFQSNYDYKLCWFCLEQKDKEHICDNKLQKINLKSKKKIHNNSFEKFCNNHIYIPKEKQNKKSKLKNLLIIKLFLYNGIININNMIFKFNKNNDILIEDINTAIEIATKSNKHRKRYTNINIYLYIGNIKIEDNELYECVNHIKKNIEFPNKNIKNDEIMIEVFSK